MVSSVQQPGQPCSHGTSGVSMGNRRELVAAVGRDLAVISELDWLTSGESHLLGQMAATPALLSFMSSITLLQRYALETCRSVKMLPITFGGSGMATCLNSMALSLIRPGSLSDRHHSWANICSQRKQWLLLVRISGGRSTHEPLQFTEILFCRQADGQQESFVSAS